MKKTNFIKIPAEAIFDACDGDVVAGIASAFIFKVQRPSFVPANIKIEL